MTKNLLVVNVLAFIATFVLERSGIDLTRLLGLHFFLGSEFHIYQFITYMFLHDGFSHIFFDAFVANGITCAEIMLCHGMVLFRGFTEPFCGFRYAFSNAIPIVTTCAEIELRLGKSLFRGFTEPFNGFFFVYFDTFDSAKIA